jgi:acyl-CoA dehydrogenase
MNPLVSLRRAVFSKPLMGFVKKVLPPISETERAALDAGTVWWDAELFAGNPDWSKLLELGPYSLSEAEQAFLDGPVEELCGMIDDWSINHEHHEVPPHIMDFITSKGFLGMIIPTEHGGLGFSAAAHSEVVSKVSARSVAVGVTIMVPNSLGPGELLLLYGTDAQKAEYLPKLASGEHIPCFGLTSLTAGSDAASMEDVGVVEKGEDGEPVIRLNFAKRYITLGPIATVLGVAFKLEDPENLLGHGEAPGITVALIPADTPGVTTGRRHYPALQAFPNGPIEGKDVKVPASWIIGGPDKAGQGWAMLMGALAADRGISLPAQATGASKAAAHTTGAYSRIREQFGVPVGKFEGVQEAMARIAGIAYELEAARRITAQAIDRGEKPAVTSAILKYHATERMRQAINDAMDVHGGKGICDGPKNYLGEGYRNIPIGITVEGANILTRNLIIFGQGAIRCHPWLLKDMEAAQADDIEAFDTAISGHVGYQVATKFRAFSRALTFGKFARVPDVGALRPEARRLMRYSAALALVSEVTLVHLGGALKRKEMISARLGDVLSELYIASAVIARFHHEGHQAADLPLARYCLDNAFSRIETALHDVLRNYPGKLLSGLMRFSIFPFGRQRHPARDEIARACADILLEPSDARDRLVIGIYHGNGDDEISRLNRAFEAITATADLAKKMREADHDDIDAAVKAGTLTGEEGERLEHTNALIREVLAVDDFDPEELSPRQHGAETRVPPVRKTG